MSFDLQVLDPAELLDGPLRHVRRQRLAMPAVLVLDLGESLALDRFGDDHGRFVGVREGLPECAVDRGEIVPVDHDRVAAERFDAAAIGVQVPAVLGLAPLPKPVDVPDRGQVGQLVVTGLVDGLPDRAFGKLGVAAQDPDVKRQLVEVLAGQRDADPDRQPLAERTCRQVDPRDRRRRMALQARAKPAEGHQLGVRDGPRGLEHGVAQRRCVTLGEDQVIVVRVLWLAPVVLQVPAQEHRNEVCGRHR